MAEKHIKNLLKLAAAPPSDKAAAWLNSAIESARASHRTANKRPIPADHNDLLADIEKSAKELAKRIQRLHRHPSTWHAFWRSSDFGPVHLNRDVAQEVRSTLENIARAAVTAKDRRKGRLPEVGRQHVVDRALGFFVRYSAHTPSGTPTGKFASFARAFYAAAIEDDLEHSGLERQIRQAVKRLPVERTRRISN